MNYRVLIVKEIWELSIPSKYWVLELQKMKGISTSGE